MSLLRNTAKLGIWTPLVEGLIPLLYLRTNCGNHEPTQTLTMGTDNANRMVYDRLEQWLIRAFNGEYLKLEDLKPVGMAGQVGEGRERV